MAGTPLAAVVCHLRRLAAPPAESDGDLLRRFATEYDEAAFARLVERHGPLVLGVCRRVLRDAEDSDDAFQATFFVLARKAASVRRSESLAGWLYRVAYRIALQARAERLRRHLRERQGHHMRRPDQPAATWDDLRPVLDEELHALPDKYRLPVVLCYLEGRTLAQAAADLGWPRGTVAGRLARARDLLRQRLTRRGVALSAGLLAALLAEGAAPAAVPAALVGMTATGAALFAGGTACGSAPAALAEAALRAFAGTKARALAALLLGLALLAAGTGLLAGSMPGTEPPAAGPPAIDRPAAAAKTKLDALRDPLPAGAVARLGTLRWRHEGEAEYLAISPDGKIVAATSQRTIIALWDAATGKVLRRFRPSQSRGARDVGPLAFSPDGKVLAWVDFQGIHLWDLAADKEVRRFVRPVRDLAGDMNILRFSPDGKLLAYRGGGPQATILDADSGKELAAVGRKEDCAPDLAFSPDSKTVAVATFKPSVQLCDAATGRLLRDIDVHFRPAAAGAGPDYVSNITFSPDGKRLAAAGRSAIVIADVATGKEIARWDNQDHYTVGLAFTPDGKSLVAGEGEPGRVRVWDVAAGKPRDLPDQGVWMGRAMALSADGKTVAMGGPRNIIRLWDVTTGNGLFPESEGHDGAVRTVAYSPDGNLLVSGGDSGHLHFWDSATGRHLRRLKGSSATTATFAPDGKRLATAWMWGPTARVWDVEKGEELLRLPHDDADRVEAIAFSADGKTVVIVTGSSNSRVHRLRSWDKAMGKPLRETSLRGPLHRLLALDGQTAVFSESSDGRHGDLHLCDLERGKELLTLRGHKYGSVCAAFSPDGQVVASGGIHDDQAARLWEVVSGQEIATLRGHERTVSAVAFSPDGRVVVSGEGSDMYAINGGRGVPQPTGPHRIRFWDAATGWELATLTGHDSDVTALALSPDGKRLASGLYNGTVILWDVPAGARAPLPAGELAAKEPDALWAALAGDVGKANPAVWALAAAPTKAVPFLKEKLRPAEAIDPKKLAGWLADLDAEEFDRRAAAANELSRLGAQAEPELRRALAANPSAEGRRQIEAILRAMDSPPSGELLRALRAVRALQLSGTPEARRLLAALTDGAPAARLTQGARAALERLAKRQTDSEKK
jgi:RNA polymerase sigma factor (sigma-70 family)